MKAEDALLMMGYKIISRNNGNKNGPDLTVIKDDVVLRVEVKKASRCRGKFTSRAKEIGGPRQSDDLVAIEFESGYVLVEPMKQYLKSTSPSTDRYFYGVF